MPLDALITVIIVDENRLLESSDCWKEEIVRPNCMDAFFKPVLVLMSALFALVGLLSGGCGDDVSEAFDSGVVDSALIDGEADDDAGLGDGGEEDGGEGNVCQELENALMAVAQNSVARGLATGVDTPQCGRWVETLGEAEFGVALTRERLFRIASVTKTFTAATVLLLAEQELLSLDDPVDDFVTGLPNGDFMTVRNLLRHESGLFDIIDDESFMQQAFADPTQPVNPEDMVTTAAAHGPVFEPGTQVSYCNTNYHVLGLIIQHVTGLSAAEAIDQQVLDPLSLTRTVLEGEPPMSDVLVPGFSAQGEDLTDILHPTIRWTAGAMVTSIDELLSWTAGLYRGDLLGPAFQTAMVEQSVNMGTSRIGLGVVIRHIAGVGEVWGHGGTAPGYRAHILYSPDLNVAVTVMANDAQTDAATVATDLLSAAAVVFQGDDRFQSISKRADPM